MIAFSVFARFIHHRISNFLLITQHLLEAIFEEDHYYHNDNNSILLIFLK